MKEKMLPILPDYLSRAGKTLLIIAVVVLSVAYVNEIKKPIVKLVPVQSPIPSVREIQQRLKDTGKERYDPGKIDGIPGPNTITAWDNLIEDRYAIREFEGE